MNPLPFLPRAALALWLMWATVWWVSSVEGDTPKAIPFVFTDIDGRQVRLTDLRGQWVLVNFWAPWCPLCKVGVPVLNELNRRPDLAVVGVALDYGPDTGKIRETLNQVGMRFHAVVAGGSRRNPDSSHRQVGPVDFFPTSYLYAPDGEIVMFIPGQIRAQKILGFMSDWHRDGPGKSRYAVNLGTFEAALKRGFGPRGQGAFTDWKGLLDALADAPTEIKLERVNDFFNRRIQADTDARVWQREDYWASPAETLGMGRGDSEDLALAKYFTLLALNVPAEQLRLVYAKPLGSLRDKAGPVHMVLAHYASPKADPALLDHLIPGVTPASRRTELKPMFSFNAQGVWGDPASAQIQGDSNRVAVWDDALRRARAEGFQ